jgi:hypothetical protein
MPANLPPDYFVEEKKLKSARTPDEKIEIIERMLAIMPHHKGTDHLIAQLRSKIAKLKEEKERHPQVQRKLDLLYNVKKEGAGQVLFIGHPNGGKSALVGALSGEPLEVGNYNYTTRFLQTRMMRYEDVWIQLVDTPAIGDESQSMWFGNMVRRADALVFVLSLSDTLELEYQLLVEETKRHISTIDTGYDRLIVVVNKADLTENFTYFEEFEKRQGAGAKLLPVSATNDMNLHILKETIFQTLGVVRVYSKLPGKKPDLETPFVLTKGSTTLDLAEKVHREFVSKLRFARLWRGAEYNGIMVSKEFVLEDRDVMELHL